MQAACVSCGARLWPLTINYSHMTMSGCIAVYLPGFLSTCHQHIEQHKYSKAVLNKLVPCKHDHFCKLMILRPKLQKVVKQTQL
jgi:hypothetical protein